MGLIPNSFWPVSESVYIFIHVMYVITKNIFIGHQVVLCGHTVAPLPVSNARTPCSSQEQLLSLLLSTSTLIEKKKKRGGPARAGKRDYSGRVVEVDIIVTQPQCLRSVTGYWCTRLTSSHFHLFSTRETEGIDNSWFQWQTSSRLIWACHWRSQRVIQRRVHQETVQTRYHKSQDVYRYIKKGDELTQRLKSKNALLLFNG